jgi:hypothetical protein
MRYLKKFILNESGGIREVGNDIFIDGMNEENHFLFPVIEILNNILQHEDQSREDMLNSFDDAVNLCYKIGDKIRRGGIGIGNDQARQSELLGGFINDIYAAFDDGLEMSEVEKILHDVVVNCKLSGAEGGNDMNYPAPDFW